MGNFIICENCEGQSEIFEGLHKLHWQNEVGGSGNIKDMQIFSFNSKGMSTKGR